MDRVDEPVIRVHCEMISGEVRRVFMSSFVMSLEDIYAFGTLIGVRNYYS